MSSGCESKENEFLQNRKYSTLTGEDVGVSVLLLVVVLVGLLVRPLGIAPWQRL